MKTFIFRAANSVDEWHHIQASTPAEAVRKLVETAGRKPFVIVAIV